MMIVLFSLPLALGVLDVAAAQVAVCLITWAGIRLDRPDSRAPLGPLAWAATVTVIAVHLVGIVVAGTGSLVRCLGSLVRCLGWRSGGWWAAMVHRPCSGFGSASAWQPRGC